MSAATIRHTARNGTAHPPVFGVMSGKKWRAEHHQPKPSIWARLITNRRPPVGKQETRK